MSELQFPTSLLILEETKQPKTIALSFYCNIFADGVTANIPPFHISEDSIRVAAKIL